MKKRNKKRPFIIVCCILVLTVLGCTKEKDVIKDVLPPKVTINPTEETIEPVEIPSFKSIGVVTDISYQEFFNKDPYSELSTYMREINPEVDQDLYNYLFQAIMRRETEVDISSFRLSNEQIMQTCSSLYDQTGFQLFYLYRVKWSNDYKTINLSYRDYSEDAINELKDTFCRKMNHLLYNVAPKEYNSYQRFYSIYYYITKHASYTDNFSDESTFSPFSILVKGKGICGGFSLLADYVLNFVDVPTEYLANEAHAWNMVTLDNKQYHTDMTWGAGDGDLNYLNTILMDDEDRMIGLNNMGYGDFPINVGFNSIDPYPPKPAKYNDFKLYRDIYNNFSLDIEEEHVYYTDSIGINRIKLDGTEKKPILETAVNRFTTYNGVIYYVNEKEQLYQYDMINAPILLDSSISVNYLRLEYGILIYGDMYENIEKKINLNKFSFLNIPKNLSHMENQVITNQQTFELKISFSDKMDTSYVPQEQIAVIYKDQIMPLHIAWNKTGDELIIRVKELLEKEMDLNVYILPGIFDNKGNKTEDGYEMTIRIE